MFNFIIDFPLLHCAHGNYFYSKFVGAHVLILFYFFSELELKVFLKLASKGAWFAGTAFILKRYINDPETLVKLFASVVLPSGIVVKYLCEGSVLCVLEASDLLSLHTLWKSYENGVLKKALEEVLITEDLKKLAEGQEIILDVDLDREMYHNACLDLIVIKEKGKS